MKRTSLLALLFLAITSYTGLSVGAPSSEYLEINTLFKQRQYDSALTRVNAYIAKNPQDAQGRFLKGVILTEQKKSAEAIKVFTGLTEDFPELPEPYNNLAVLYAAQGQYDKAKNALEMAIRNHPGYATAHENLGDIYAKMAAQAYDKALQLDNKNTSAQIKLGLIKDMFGNHKDSSPIASKSADTKPGVGSVVNSDVTTAVQAWANAWASQNASAYFASYSPQFKTPNGEPRSVWENVLRERISTPKTINIELSNIQITNVSNDLVSVSFDQAYKPDRLQFNSRKILTLAKTNGKWLITEERSR